jgi:urease accessory protein
MPTPSYAKPILPAAAVLAPGVAFAHHVMGGATPATFTQGLLSGLGHPVIGIDHLAFLLAVGIAVGASGLPLLTPAIFVAGSALGVALHLQGIALPAGEFLVAASVLLIGIVVAIGPRFSVGALCTLFALAGFGHGHAFGESIVGAEPSPVYAYLLGLSVIQMATTTAVTLLLRKLSERMTVVVSRTVGLAVAAVGVAGMTAQVYGF